MRLCSLAASRCSSLYGGADFLRSIIPSRRISFNPASSAPAHKSCSALRSPSAPAGSVRHPPIPERPACRSAYCAPAPRPAPQREISGGQFWVWERPRLGGWCLVFRFWLDNVCPEVGECSAICCFLLSSHLKSVQNCLDKYKRSRNIHKNLDAHQYYN